MKLTLLLTRALKSASESSSDLFRSSWNPPTRLISTVLAAEAASLWDEDWLRRVAREKTRPVMRLCERK